MIQFESFDDVYFLSGGGTAISPGSSKKTGSLPRRFGSPE